MNSFDLSAESSHFILNRAVKDVWILLININWGNFFFGHSDEINIKLIALI